MNSLAAIFDSLGRYSEAQDLLRRALDIQVKSLGEKHPETAGTMNNLATICFHQGRYEEAEAHWTRALRIYEDTPGTRQHLALMLNNYARLMRKTGRKSDAKKLESRARAIFSGSRPDEWDRFTVDVNDLLAPRK